MTLLGLKASKTLMVVQKLRLEGQLLSAEQAFNNTCQNSQLDFPGAWRDIGEQTTEELCGGGGEKEKGLIHGF